MSDQKYTIGSRIRHYRVLRGMTQKELASAVGYTSDSSKTTINKIEAGQRDVSQSRLPRFAEALGVSVLDLLGIEESAETSATPQTPDDLLAFALFGDSSVVTAEDLEDIRKFAAFIKDRRKNDRS